MTKESLAKKYPEQIEVPALIVLSVICLILGLTLPILTFEEMIFWKHTFTVLTGIQSLYEEGHYILALVVFLFSVIFPIVKLSFLLIIWYCKFTEPRRRWLIGWVSQMGRWSMLDVFVVAIVVVIGKMSQAASAEPRRGIYIFATSIIFAMLAASRLERLRNVEKL